jgi:hypothetical protein
MSDPTFGPNILVIQGPGIPAAYREADGLIIKMSEHSEALIHLIGRLSHRKTRLQLPDGKGLSIAPIHTGKQVTIQFCGSRINETVDAMRGVDDFAQVGEAVKWLFDYCQSNMSVVRT